MRPFRLLSVIVATCLSAAAARAALPQTQSLAEIAKKEEERRKSAQPAKVYTNKDLTPAPPGSPQPAANGAPKDAKDGGAKDAKNPADAKDAKGGSITIIADGTMQEAALPNRFITGTWTQTSGGNTVKGDFRIRRQ